MALGRQRDKTSLEVAQNSLFLTLLELGAIFLAWNCTILNGSAIF